MNTITFEGREDENSTSAGSASFTYAEFEAAAKQCRWLITSAPGEPSIEYATAISENPDAIKLADESWHKGMDEMQTALLNWAYDKIALASQHPPTVWHRASEKLPTEEDGDFEGCIWVFWVPGFTEPDRQRVSTVVREWNKAYKHLRGDFLWSATNFTKPKPPEV